MNNFQRYAVYYLPDDPALAGFGARWLGWNVETGVGEDHFPIPDLDEITATPRRYGFHGTVKPPFRLAEGTDFQALEAAVADFTAQAAPVVIDGLAPAKIGRFLALVPEGDAKALAALAFATVQELDRFRAPPSAAELERRRAAGLTPAQDELLLKWGYPYVGPEFRFHLTLSGKLDADTADRTLAQIKDHVPNLPRPFPITSLALAGEDANGFFHLIRRFAL